MSDEMSGEGLAQDQTKSLASVFFVFAGFVLSVTAFLIGTKAGQSVPLKEGLAALFVGNMILATYAGMIGLIGMKTRRSSTVILRPVFGLHGQILVSALITFINVSFVSVYASMIGSQLASFYPVLSPYFGLLAFVFVVGAVNWFGFKGLSLLGRIGVPALAVFVVMGLFKVHSKVGFDALAQAVPTEPLPWIVVLSFVTASWMTGGTLSSDMTRFARKPSYVFIVTFGAFLCVTLLEAVGLICSLGAGEGNLVSILNRLGLDIMALFIYLILGLTSGQAIVYSFSLAVMNITKVLNRGKESTVLNARFWVTAGCLFAAAVGVIMTKFGLLNSFKNFLTMIGIVVPPVGGLIMAHFLIVERDFERPFEAMPAVRVTAFIAWACGIAGAYFLKFGVIPLNGFFVAVIAYTVLRFAVTGRPIAQRAAEKMGNSKVG
ncbi:MAG: cytosine permease [Kiritimatiellae bacterium]|nr:cytosine permease [Kiritimatiellia bacterium]